MGKVLIICGVILVIVGLLFQFASKIPWLGRLPGDVKIEKGNFTVYFPIMTSILLSIALSLIVYFINKGRG
jgi:hypothetical protein